MKFKFIELFRNRNKKNVSTIFEDDDIFMQESYSEERVEHMGYYEKKRYEQKITEKRLLKEFELENEDIEILHDQGYPYASIIKTNKNKKKAFDITVGMRNDNLPYYVGNLAHELCHVKTWLELKEQIGFDKIVELFSEPILEKQLAFRTISEYKAWYKAVKDYDDNPQASYLFSKVSDYKNKRITLDMMCDNIASHAAAYEAKNIPINYGSIEEQDKIFVDTVIKIIMPYRDKWPDTYDEFTEIGKSIISLAENFS